MKGDFTRWTFSREKHYSSVRMQQGRVQMDADWNEQTDIAAHRIETEALDVIGRCGAPARDAGFRLFTDVSRLNADERRWLPATPLPALETGDFFILGGRYYVDGILVENESAVLFSQQPDLPSEPLKEPGLYVAYLDVWRRHITALEDPSIREVALGGPDHGTRTKTVWQLKTVRVQDRNALQRANCGTDFEEYRAATAVPTGRMRARAKPEEDQTTPCVLPPGAGFRRLENQLYCVEIHRSGGFGTAAFKWSRENGSVAARVESISGSEITLTAPGRDQLLGFATGDWIEVTDDLHELRGEPGSLIRIIEVNDRVLTVEAATLDGPAITQTEYQLGANAKVRRWESAGAQVVRLNVDGNGVVVEDGYLPLEDGVQVRFETGTFRTGDYWVIPARTEGATVEWPADGTQPAALAPHGIEHHYCRVGLISFTRALTRIDDCRCLFQPLCACGIRVRGVTLGVSTDQTAGRLTAVALRNDTEITLNQFARGVVVECDRDIDPETVSRATCFITVEAPMVMPGQEGPAAGRIFGYQNIVLNPAIVRAEGARIFWAADPFTVLALSRALQTAAGQRAMLARLTLKGNFIQSAGSLAHLDGDTFSIRERGDRNTPLRSPSGDGRDGGDFECWFWLAQFCDETFPRGYVPFGSNIQLTAADVRGDRVVVGTMTPDSFRVTRNLRLPDFDNQAYCGPVQLAPGRFFVAYVQTALERGGNYSSFGAPLIDPLTGGQFPGNVIPANRLPGIGATAPAQAGTYAWRVREIVDAPYYPYSSADFRGIGSDLI